MKLLSEMSPLQRVLKQGDWICKMKRGDYFWQYLRRVPQNGMPSDLT